MTLGRSTTTFALFLALAAPAPAQGPVNLAEEPQPGDCSRYVIELSVTGQLILNQEGRKEPIRLEAKARHRFAERTLGVADGLVRRSVRHYEEAQAKAVAGLTPIDRDLSAERRSIVAERSSDGVLCYSPAGLLTREELDTVAEHFNPQCLPGLLPGKAVNVGDTWKLDPPTAQAACLFEGLVKFDLTGKLIGVDMNRATFAIEGTAEGIDGGAPVKLSLAATGKFDLASKRVVELTWKQKDERGEGPISPASTIEAAITLTRQPLAAAPAELTDVAVAALPKESAPASLTLLRYTDPKGRYQATFPRAWHVTGQTDNHLILRLLDRGELLAQATVSAWKKAEPGQHTPAQEFKKTVAELPGWAAKQVLDDGELQADNGRWLYRLTAVGEMDGLPVVQAFHLLAGPKGHQVAVTVVTKPEKVKAVDSRDLGLVTAIVFPEEKK